jgi:uncharacterized protein (TIGR00725 family)
VASPAPHDRYVAVVGQGEAGPETEALAYDVGRLLAEAGGVVLTGGLATGVMGAAARGAREAGGRTVGVLRDAHARSASPHLDVALSTGLHELRNPVLVNSARAVVAIGGGWGTLNEIALAVRQGKTVVALRSWEPAPPGGKVSPVLVAESPQEAVELVLDALQGAGGGSRLSLWLEPEDPASLRAWTDGAAARSGVTLPAEDLPLHVTLGSCRGLEEREVAAAAGLIAGRLAPVRFERAGFASFAGDPHRVLTVLADPAALLPAFDLLRSELPAAEPSSPPHISLAYGDLGPRPCLAVLNEVHSPTSPMPDRFLLGRLSVRDTTGEDHSAWRSLGEWSLGG